MTTLNVLSTWRSDIFGGGRRRGVSGGQQILRPIFTYSSLVFL